MECNVVYKWVCEEFDGFILFLDEVVIVFEK